MVDGEYSFESGVDGAKHLMNIDIPGDLSIVGFENSPFSRQTWPKLTTKNQPNQQIAQRTTTLLINSIKSQHFANTCELFVQKLLERDSSAKVQT